MGIDFQTESHGAGRGKEECPEGHTDSCRAFDRTTSYIVLASNPNLPSDLLQRKPSFSVIRLLAHSSASLSLGLLGALQRSLGSCL